MLNISVKSMRGARRQSEKHRRKYNPKIGKHKTFLLSQSGREVKSMKICMIYVLGSLNIRTLQSDIIGFFFLLGCEV